MNYSPLKKVASLLLVLSLTVSCMLFPADDAKPAEVYAAATLSVTTQPKSVTAKPGATVKFTVKARGSGTLKYQWYYKKAGSSGWTLWKNHTKASTSGKVAASWNLMKVRCKVSNRSKSVYSKAATVTVNQPLTILEQPQSVTAKEGATVTFKVKAQGKGAIKYQWYYKKSGSSSWTLWKGHTSASTSGKVNSTWNGMNVRCKVTDTAKTVYSKAAVVTLKATATTSTTATTASTTKTTAKTTTKASQNTITITKQPEEITVHSGDKAEFSVTASSKDSLTYQWYYKKAGKSAWTLWSGKNTATITATADHTWHGMQVYCRITDGKGGSADSSVAYVLITKQGSKRYFKRSITITNNYTKVYDGVGTKCNVVAKINAKKTFEALEWAADENDTTWYCFKYNEKLVWVPRTAVSVVNDYTTIPDRNFKDGGIPIIYISPYKQMDNKFAYGNTTEQEQMYRVGRALKKILDEEYYCMTYIPSTSLPLGLKNRAYDAYIRESDVYLAIHSNAISSKTVYGAIGYYSPSCNQGKVLSQNIISEMKKIALKKATVTNQLREGMSAYDNTGYGEVRDPTYYGMVGVLAEVEYHDNQDSAKWIINNTDKIARALANALESTFGLQKKA